jgi:hypothetical protein
VVCTGVCKEGSGENRQRERPYRMALSHGVMGGRRACVLTELSQGAVEGGGEPRGESAPVVSVLTSTQGHRVTTAALGVGIVVVACLSRLAPSRAGAHGAEARRQRSLAFAPRSGYAMAPRGWR